MTRDALPIYTIFERPADYPEEFVCRVWYAAGGAAIAGRLVARGQSLADVRRQLLTRYAGLTCLGREPGDDPVIVESWL